ncbi:uncharacterized protein LOC114534138 isoform X3 [Dendronephthya gigantea]|uniref:uncharacterized protein LOC114534138 isoform X2 n=1 Tax=Dendronephthya gigantea TaxID=151771 RepID=UPI00106A673E|nr:uncharacterized protein LOC114534138 isoform X2 [Dendronephthya gigantea]XP_028411489.1 uncharacterized protein LOC114534138 isoform X3 [Dendronephthya gigantea]
MEGIDKKQEASGSTSVCEYLRDDGIASKSQMQSSSLAIVKFLVKYCGADVRLKDESGKTVLHHAVDGGTTDIVKFFVEQCSADVNGEDTKGRAALYYAVTEGSLEMVEYLVEKGADVNGKDTGGRTVLHAAVTKGKLEMVKHIFDWDADVNGKGLTKGTLEIVKYLVEHGGDVKLKSERSDHTLGIDILEMAVEKNSVALVNLVLEKNIAAGAPWVC